MRRSYLRNVTLTARLLTALGLLGSIAIAAMAVLASPPPDGGSSAAARAVRALVSEPAERAQEELPPDFAVVMGYAPVLEEGWLVRQDGSCSSPVALPAVFEPVCREHDLGYDLLRYAALTGESLGTWARDALDDRFARRLLDSCAEDDVPARVPGCLASAHVAAAAVEVNSARQLDGPPVESPASRAMTTAGAVGLGAGGGSLLMRRRR